MDGVSPTGSTKEERSHGAARKRGQLWAAACLLLALVPALNIWRILAANGVDTVSNDYLMFIQQADRFLSGRNDWRQYFSDTMYMRVHSYAFLFPVRLLLLRLSHMSVNAEIAAGMLLAAARLLLLYRLLTMLLPGPPGRRWFSSPYLWLLPALSALVFANAQISTFSYGETILQFGFVQVFTLAGLMILRRPPRGSGIWLAAACGLLASYSGGSGLAAWPVFLLAIVWRHTRRPAAYLVWLAGAAAAAWPYLAYGGIGYASLQPPSLPALLTGLGLPFANNINFGVQAHPQAAAAGALGLALAAVSLGLLWRLVPRAHFAAAAPPLLLLAWGGMYAVQVMLTRQLIAPWYTTGYSLFWAGLLGMAALFQSCLPPRPWNDRRTAVLAGWGAALVVVLALLYAGTNRTFADKSFYLASRSPASAACLRNYLSAPTTCEGLVFQWNLGTPANLALLGEPLARQRLSVLAQAQEWTLQGDMALGRVQWRPGGTAGLTAWAQGANDRPAHWTEAAHLNVLVSAGQSLRWQFDLPAGLGSAVFRAAVSPSAGSACSTVADETYLSIGVEDQRGGAQSLLPPVHLCRSRGWQPVSVDLSAYAGQRVTLVLTVTGDDPVFSARLRYPRIRLAGVPLISGWRDSPQPSNVDAVHPADIAARAYRMPLGADGWQFEHLLPQDVAGRFEKQDPTAIARFDVDDALCLRDWSVFYLQAAMDDSSPRRLVLVRFTFAPGETQAILPLPLLAGEQPRTYTLDLNLLDAPADACIRAVELILSYFLPPDGASWISMPEAGFLPRAAP